MYKMRFNLDLTEDSSKSYGEITELEVIWDLKQMIGGVVEMTPSNNHFQRSRHQQKWLHHSRVACSQTYPSLLLGFREAKDHFSAVVERTRDHTL